MLRFQLIMRGNWSCSENAHPAGQSEDESVQTTLSTPFPAQPLQFAESTSSVQFSSVQIYALGKALSEVSPNVAFETIPNVRLIDQCR